MFGARIEVRHGVGSWKAGQLSGVIEERRAQVEVTQIFSGGKGVTPGVGAVVEASWSRWRNLQQRYPLGSADPTEAHDSSMQPKKLVIQTLENV